LKEVLISELESFQTSGHEYERTCWVSEKGLGRRTPGYGEAPALRYYFGGGETVTSIAE
jgi:hypothetical protein